ncbi:IS200/IS605 family transposase [Micromonospora sp. IBHARD004]|uniref:IS200/IS605 family transposase n=1 Tax=Micromonospora sp. IBHARD004 TaxID=3457764 RepID=UPI004059EC1D
MWCPKYRRPVLVGSVADRLRDLIGQKCDEHGWSVPALEVMPDHVHLVVRADPTASPSYVANQLKGFTSRTGARRGSCASRCATGRTSGRWCCRAARCSWCRAGSSTGRPARGARRS